MKKKTEKIGKTEKTMPIPRKAKKKNNYFTKVHEEAIINYTLTTDNKIRTELPF